MIKTYHLQIFLFFSITERVRKGSDLPKKKGVTDHPTKIFAHQVNAKVISSIFFKFSTWCERLKITWTRVPILVPRGRAPFGQHQESRFLVLTKRSATSGDENGACLMNSMRTRDAQQTRTHCCGHIVADTNVSPFAPARNICCGHKFCVRETKMFLILFRNILCPQQMIPSLRSMETQHSFCVPRVCAPKKHHEQQCVRNNVSSFARALRFTDTMSN